MNMLAPRQNMIPDAWINRPADETFGSLTQLFDYTRQMADLSDATVHKASDIQVLTDQTFSRSDAMSALQLRLPDGRITWPSNWSFSQLASLVSQAQNTAGVLRSLPAPIAAVPLQYLISAYRGELVKSYVNQNTGELRAMTSPTYGRILDCELVDALREIAGNGTGDRRWVAAQVLHGRAPGFYASDRNMFVFLVDKDNPIIIARRPNGDPDVCYRGIMVWNSEVGSKSLGIRTFLFRAYCDNRLVFGTQHLEEVTIRHTKNAVHRFLGEAKPAIEAYANASAQDITVGIQQSMARVLADDDKSAAAVLQERMKMSAAAAKAAIEQHLLEEDKPARSAWDLAQAATAYARAIPHQDERVALETAAGRVLALAA